MTTYDLSLNQGKQTPLVQLKGADLVREWGEQLRAMIADVAAEVYPFISLTGRLQRVDPIHLPDTHVSTWVGLCNESIGKQADIWLRGAWAEVSPSALNAEVSNLRHEFDMTMAHGDRSALFQRIMRLWSAIDNADLILAKAKILRHPDAGKWETQLNPARSHLMESPFLVIATDVMEQIASIAQTARREFAEDDPLGQTLKKYVWALRQFEKAHRLT